MAHSKLVSFKSEEGEQLLKDILSETDDSRKYIQPNLIASHYRQKTNATCGIASCVMLFNSRRCSLQMPPINEYWLLMQPLLSQAVNVGHLLHHGLTLSEVSHVLDAFKCTNNVVHCKKKKDKLAEDRFRGHCREVFQCHDGHKGIIVNYWMPAIGQPFNYGHHSPIAAYHEKSDRVLLLDCWEPNVCWVKIHDLFRAMATLDGQLFRGYLVVNNVHICNAFNHSSKL